MDKIKAYIGKHSLLTETSEVVVALSGGADSVALLLTLHKAGYAVTAVHCNFHLRGAESDRDMEFCRSLCRSLDIQLLVKHFDVKARMKSTGESVEMACRSLRYAWFDEILAGRPDAMLAVAHHRDDNVETFFLNALRGSGIAGLRGMLPRNGRIIRPMLDVTREEIESYLRSEETGFIVDSTNNENTFRRNRLRNVVIPCLEQQFPGAVSRISATIENLRADDTLLSDYDAWLRDRFVSAEGVINVSSVISTHPHPREVLYRLLRGTGISLSRIDDILARPQASGLFFGNYTLDRGKLRPLSGETLPHITVVPGVTPLMMSHLSPADFRPVADPSRIWLDAEALLGNPVWELRPWHVGDRFKPFGMKGSKKLSDLFSDRHLDENAKRNTPVLTRNGDIIWVVGIRASRLFPVTASTSDIIELTLKL